MRILETRRLVLRRLVPEDLDGLYALYKDPEIRRYFPEGTLSFEDTKGWSDYATFAKIRSNHSL